MPDSLRIVPEQRTVPPIFDPMPDANIPTLFEWAGGIPARERLTSAIHERVRHNGVLAPVVG